MQAKEIRPSYETLPSGEMYSDLLDIEYMQCYDEGLDIEPLKPLMESISALKRSKEREDLANTVFEMICRLPMREGYPYDEPSDLAGIRALCRPAPELPKAVLNDRLRDQVHGAWIGRIAGCLLGKPVEGYAAERIENLLRKMNNYPMNRYFMAKDFPSDPTEREACRNDIMTHALADTIPYAIADDDTNYTVLGWKLIEQYGRDFTPENVLALWVASQPQKAYYTAEYATFNNYVNGYRPPVSALYHNPYREWIGAQIRGDYFGYINPGDPVTAADMAWRDASISHVKNGIYGEMFAAAMISAAAVTSDMETIIQTGLSQIPATSRLHEAITDVLNDFHAGMTFEQFSAAFHQKYNSPSGHVRIHTIPNAILVAAALLYGGGDFGRTICMAVQNALDTDCNGATAGSIVGMICGASAIPEQWTKPLNGQVETQIGGLGVVPITDMVERTLKHLKCC